jgi:hypothetical protein
MGRKEVDVEVSVCAMCYLCACVSYFGMSLAVSLPAIDS